MKLSQMGEVNTSREMIDVFGGYNHNLRIAEGEFYDMENMTADDYPVLSPRAKRGIYASLENPKGIIAKDTVCYVDGSELYIGGEAVEGFSLDASTEKTLISMGAYIIIMPDKKYINTKDYSDKGDIEVANTSSGTVTMQMCDESGAVYAGQRAIKGIHKPKIGADGDIYLNTETKLLEKYDAANQQWISIQPYVRITATGIALNLKSGDNITIEGITAGYGQLAELLCGEQKLITNIYGGSSIWFPGYLYYYDSTEVMDKLEATQSTPITVKRSIPNMDFVIESNNRLWGCRYGESIDGQQVNEIYASKLGDFKNWYSFRSISTDSYAATVGSDGPFTGAFTHLGYPIFFKENCMHKIYGDYPANYQIQTTNCRGVQLGCEKSLATVNEVLFYKSRHGVCVYDGSLPQAISSALGDVYYHDAVAGSIGNKYYISMADKNDDWHMFVYDASRGTWHREDYTCAQGFCENGGELYFINYGDKQIKTVRGSAVPEDKEVKWRAVTGIIGVDSPDKKYISRLDVRMSLKVGTRVSFFAEYDSCGEWKHLFTMDGISLRTFAIPIRPQRCDHMRLKIIGEGEAKIYSICKTVEQGSDV